LKLEKTAPRKTKGFTVRCFLFHTLTILKFQSLKKALSKIRDFNWKVGSRTKIHFLALSPCFLMPSKRIRKHF
jgi:hypothetical protein